MTITESIISINSVYLNREVTCTLLSPQGKEFSEPLNLLLLNDGQEAESLSLTQTLQNLYDNDRIKPVLVVAIHAGEERLQEYGAAGKSDYKLRGSKAETYTQFIINELLPLIVKETGVTDFGISAFGGFSLGGLSAFDIAWNNPQLFDKVGVFSGSFWWRSKALDKDYTDNDRIMHSIVRNAIDRPELKFWLQTGTKDEIADRNKNGIIDSIDDTIDLIIEMEKKGFTRPADIQYLEVVGGSHDTTTWAEAMPKFLCWAFGR